MVMAWLWHGYGMVMAWLWHGYGMVMAWLWQIKCSGQYCYTKSKTCI